PASTMKLIVGAVALEVLGDDYAFVTRLYGSVADGVVQGDLVMVGGGDPVLSTADYPETQPIPPTVTTSLEALVANLAAAGVTRINGGIVVDESRYDTERYAPGWGADIRDVEAGPLSALMVNDAIRQVGVGN
ncbi:MAG TPA: D-alanyl-D-alanine carboxypeptidase, partial [Ilumatobacteraceae bacterium]|nr:D-alanyl-D-alanine carboxypeptidase [Ilumatobacteraceae bacterium]